LISGGSVRSPRPLVSIPVIHPAAQRQANRSGAVASAPSISISSRRVRAKTVSSESGRVPG